MLIGKKLLAEEQVISLIQKIKEKKELKEISDDFVRDELFKYFQINPKSAEVISKPKSTRYKNIVKENRSKLRRVYGLFRIDEQIKKRRGLVEQYLKRPSSKLIAEILKTHSSTEERLPYYVKLYEKIFKITGKPKGIIDLGCGVNPFSLPYMNLRSLQYHAYDISEEEIFSLREFFSQLHAKDSFFQGYAEVLDALHFAQLEKLDKVDLCFLFKMTDVLDRGKGHAVTEEVMRNLPANFLVISFPTKTMSGKKMNFPRRKWMELLCQRLGYKFKTLNLPNEIFYVIKK